MKKSLFVILTTVLLSFTAIGQTDGVLIDYAAGTRDNTAVFQINSISQGFLVPRVDLDNATAPISATKPTGLLVYNVGGSIGANGFYYWDGTAWVMIANTTNGIKWNAITAPDGNQTLNMGTHLTSFNWATGTGASDLFSYSSVSDANGTGSLVSLNTPGSSNALSPFEINTRGNSTFFVSSNGRTGMGTNAPTAQLEVKGSTTSSGAVTMTIPASGTTFTTSGNITIYPGDYVIPTTTTAQARVITVGGTGTSFTVSGAFSGAGQVETFTIHHPVHITNSAGTSSLYVQGSTGNVGIGTTVPGRKLQVNGDAYVSTRLGVGVDISSAVGIRVRKSNASTLAGSGIENIFTVTNATLTAPITESGLFNQLTNSQTTALGFALTEYGINNLLTQTAANTKMTDGYGIQNRVLQNIATGTITNAYGAYNQVYNQAGTISGNAWANYNHVSSNGNVTADARGSYNYLTVNGGTYTNAYAQRNFIERTTGTISNAYGTYTSFSGTIGTKWGTYVTGEDKNYFSGSVGIGDDTPVSPLTVGTGDLFQVASNGDIVKIKNMTYSWPVSYGGGSTFLRTDASGNLTWAAALTSEVDGSITNEGALTVSAGTPTTSTITSNTSGSTAVTLTAGVGLVNSELGNTITTAFDYAATLSSEPTGATLGANQTVMGSNGIILEGSTANTFEGFLTVANPTADRTWVLPDASGTVAVSATAPIAVSSAGDVSFTGWPANATGVLANNGSGTLSWTTAGTSLLTAGNDIDFSGTNQVDVEPQLDFVHTIIAPSANNLLLRSQTGRDMTFQTNGANTRMTIASAGTVGVNIAPHADRMFSSQTATTTADGAAIWGSATANGRVYGVYGSIAATTDNAAGVRGYSAGAGNVYGIFGEATSTGTTLTGAGTRGLISGTGHGLRGVYAQNQATGAGAQYGLFAEKTGNTVSGTGYGVYGSATGTAATNYGGYFTGSGGTANYGVVVPSTGGNSGFGTIAPAAKLDVAGDVIMNSQTSVQNRRIFTLTRTVAHNVGDYVELGTITSNGAGTYITISESHHFCGTINTAIYDFSDNYYSGATTGWMQVPTQNFRGHNGAQDYAVDVRRTATHGSANLEIRFRSLGGACGSGTANFEIQTNGVFTASSGSGTGATVAAGYLSTNAYQFPVSNDRYKASNDGIFIVNSGNVGVGTTAPVAKLEVAGQVKITGGSPGAGKVLTSDASGLATWTIPSGTAIRTVFSEASDYVFYSDAYITFRWQASGDDVQLAAQTGHTGWWDYTYWGETHHQILPNSGDHGSDDVNLGTGWSDFNGADLFAAGDSEYGGGVTIFISKEDSNTYPTYKLEILRHGSYVTSLVTVYY
jgi:hypothetical protein